VPLEAEGGPVAALDALQGAVEQGAVRDLQAVRQLCIGNGEAVVLAGDEHATRCAGPAPGGWRRGDRISFFRARAAGQGQQLVSQADTEQGNLRVQEFADRIDGVVQGSGSPGPLERNTPSGLIAITSSAGVCAGTTVISQPRSASMRRMLRLTPKS
jgi:hypothetical protein